VLVEPLRGVSPDQFQQAGIRGICAPRDSTNRKPDHDVGPRHTTHLGDCLSTIRCLKMLNQIEAKYYVERPILDRKAQGVRNYEGAGVLEALRLVKVGT
jgi:hypothetical protein